MSGRRDMQLLVKELRRAGFNVTRTGSGHWKVQHPSGGESVILAFSPNGSSFHKSLIRLRRIGYVPER